jgi:hypothetical protein
MKLKPIVLVFLAVVIVAGLLWAQPLVMGKCPLTPPVKRLVWWTGSELTCAQLPAGWGLSGTPTVLTIPRPTWQVETVSFANLLPGSTSISYTTLQPPISGIVNYWYNASNLLDATSGVVVFTGNPLSFSLPSDWSTADTITVSYQSQ